MATKIGYVRRDPSENINWAEVGSNFSGMLREEARVREETKAQIDRDTQESINILKNAPMGDSKNMNEWALTFGSDAQNQLLMTNALLKSGQLKPKDYTVIRQNLADGTDQAFTLAQEYQSEYADKMARAKANPGTIIGPDGKPITGSQRLETFLMESAEGFGNFEKSKLVINPITGNVMVGFINENGVVEKDPNKLIGINYLRNRIKVKYDAYDIDSAIGKAKEGVFGAFTKVSGELGGLYQKGMIITANGPQLRNAAGLQELVDKGIMTAEEAKLLGDIQTTENSWAESQLSNRYNTTSLLTNNLGGFAPNGKEYTFTDDPNGENENTILIEKVGNETVPNFDSPQGKIHRKNAKQGLLDRLRGALDIKIDSQAIGGNTPPQQQEWQSKKKDKVNENIMLQEAWGKLFYGTPEEIVASSNTLLGSPKSIAQGLAEIDTKSKPGYVILTYNGSGTILPGEISSRTIPMVNQTKDSSGKIITTPVPYNDFLNSGIELIGVPNKDTKVEKQLYNEGAGGTKTDRTSTKKQSKNPIKNLDDYINSNQPADNLFGNSDGSGFEKHINDKYSTLGFSAKKGTYTDVVTVTAPNGKKTDIRHNKDASTPRAQLIAFVKANTPKTTDADLLVLLSLGAGGGGASQF
jgi:hypothetical protein